MYRTELQSLRHLHIAALIHSKGLEAHRMAAEHHAAFEDLNDSIDPHYLAAWESLSTEPSYKDGRWISVFSMTESQGGHNPHCLGVQLILCKPCQ